MHETTQRRLLLILFFVCCVAPTLATLGWIVSHQFRFRVDRMEQLLADASGLTIQIQRITYPRPRHRVLHHVEVADPENGASIASARVVELIDVEGGCVVVAAQPTIQLDQPVELWRLMEYRGLRRAWPSGGRVDVYADDLTLESSAGTQTVSLLAQGESLAEGPWIKARLRLAGDAGKAAPLQVQVRRQRVQGRPSTTVVHVDSARSVPCALFGPHFPWRRFLGGEATFRGSLTAKRSDGTWRVALKDAELKHVDLQRLVHRLPHELSGMASIRCSRINLAPGKVTANFQLQAGPGRISASLLHAMSDHLECELARPDAPRTSSLAYDRLALSVELALDEEGRRLTIRADAAATKADGILADAEGPLLRAPAGASEPMRLIAALMPSGGPRLPAVHESLWLLNFLQLPSALDVAVPGKDPKAKVQLVSGEEEAGPIP